MHKILGFVGPTGSGKTTLILELLERFPDTLGIMQSITTRPSRGADDDLFFTRATHDEVRSLEAEGHLLQVSEYAENLYANDKRTVDGLLAHKHGMMAIVEQGVMNFRNAGYDVIVIKIIPMDNPAVADPVRKTADAERSKTGLQADFEVVNSFKPGGKETALKSLSTFIRKLDS